MLVNKEIKNFKINTIFPSKLSWEFSKKEEYNPIIQKCQMIFQASEFKERKFLKLNNNDNSPICFTYSKNRAWLKYFGFSKSLYTQVTRLITNHAQISEYRLKFFFKEPIAYLCGNYPIKTRRYILFKYLQYKKS